MGTTDLLASMDILPTKEVEEAVAAGEKVA
ncbi:hypothetical protein SDC9_146777 [bioreactor metagenome]|uniref:Uncharacterized protein n=1 Tax=bioreactor metagenome TaxID=1076179 RepID=A0A645EDS4_9ZZZZ